MNPFEEGQMILVNKPLRWTSADVVKKIRNRVHAKVGHAGTLDPLATGLLILCTGKFTKKISEYMSQEKEYTGTLHWAQQRLPMIWKQNLKISEICRHDPVSRPGDGLSAIYR